MTTQVPESEPRSALGLAAWSRWPLALGVVLALAVLALTLLLSTLRLRDRIRGQMVRRDGQILEAVAALQYLQDEDNGLALSPLSDPGEQIQLALEISRLRNVIGVRLFSPEGDFVNGVPAYLAEATLPRGDLAQLRQLRSACHFVPQAQLEDYLLVQTNRQTVPLLEVNIPLREDAGQALVGIVQFLMNGSSLDRDYADLDRHLAAQGLLAFGIGGSIIALGLVLAFHRIERVNRLLSERTANLLKANRELALAAKTSAVGAVTAHLIHGLKNPLSVLRSFVRNRAVDSPPATGDDWRMALASTQRMQDLINRVVRVLQEQHTAVDYEISMAELIELVKNRFQTPAQAAGVTLETENHVVGNFSNHEADLLLLILENLLQNAIESTPRGKAVRLRGFELQHHVAVEVQDEGPGLAPGVAARLFMPCISAKQQGSGIGLAISRQLAQHLGADLTLERSSPQGCIFRLVLPATTCPASLARSADAAVEQPRGAQAL